MSDQPSRDPVKYAQAAADAAHDARAPLGGSEANQAHGLMQLAIAIENLALAVGFLAQNQRQLPPTLKQ